MIDPMLEIMIQIKKCYQLRVYCYDWSKVINKYVIGYPKAVIIQETFMDPFIYPDGYI